MVFREIAKYITKIVDMRKTAVFRFFTHPQKGRDGVIFIAAFLVGFRVRPQQDWKVSCQEGWGWKIRILAVFWLPAQNSSAHGVERQWVGTRTAGRESSARISADITFGITRNGTRI